MYFRGLRQAVSEKFRKKYYPKNYPRQIRIQKSRSPDRHSTGFEDKILSPVSVSSFWSRLITVRSYVYRVMWIRNIAIATTMLVFEHRRRLLVWGTGAKFNWTHRWRNGQWLGGTMVSAEHEPIMGVWGQKPPEAESILVIGCPTEPANLAPLVKFSK